MAKDTLVTGDFTDAMKDAGLELLRRLDDNVAEIKSAFWLYMPEVKSWKLILASQKVDEEGPREFYKRVIDVSKNSKPDDFVVSLNDIGVTNLSNPLVRLIGIAIGTPADALAGIRFTRNTINGNFIEDAYIYRSSILQEVKRAPA